MSNFRNVVRSYSPEALTAVGRDFDGLFEQLFGTGASNCKSTNSPTAEGVKLLRAPSQVWEQDNLLHIQLELPGVPRDSVSVTFDQGEIHIKADKKGPELGESHILHNNRNFGSYHHRVAVGDSYDAESIVASMVDGLLHLQIAKKPVAEPRKIEIQ